MMEHSYARVYLTKIPCELPQTMSRRTMKAMEVLYSKSPLEIACSSISTTIMRVAISSITATGYQKSRFDACEWKLHRFIESHVSRCVRMERRGLHITPTQHKFICSPHLNRKTRHIAMTHIKPNNKYTLRLNWFEFLDIALLLFTNNMLL